jgi:hypothetical protein
LISLSFVDHLETVVLELISLLAKVLSHRFQLRRALGEHRIEELHSSLE